MRTVECYDIFEQLRDDTLIVIPVDGSFECRIRSHDYKEGINPASLHGQLIKRLGESIFKSKVDAELIKGTIKTTSIKMFNEAHRNYYSIGDCISIEEKIGTKTIIYVLLIASWLDINGEAHLSSINSRTEELRLLDLIYRGFIEYIQRYFSEREIRVPIIGTGILRSELKQTHLEFIEKKLYDDLSKANFKNCALWKKPPN